MAYIVGQYNHNNASSDDASFITPITTGTATRYNGSSSTNVAGSSLESFSDECITNLGLVSSNYYYFRCQIKRMVMPQTFSIKLINYNDSSVEQFIKQVTIQGSNREEWVNVDFVFHPLTSFDTILFQLQRTSEDYQGSARYPKIAYQQLGSINNIINTKVGNNISLLKIGVQSHPGLAMCINGEEIHISRTGIFEIKNGIIPVTFFSVVNPATEATSTVDDWIATINQQIEDIENDPSLTPDQKEAAYRAINSRCFFDTSKVYKIDAFTLDYMYNNN